MARGRAVAGADARTEADSALATGLSEPFRAGRRRDAAAGRSEPLSVRSVSGSAGGVGKVRSGRYRRPVSSTTRRPGDVRMHRSGHRRGVPDESGGRPPVQVAGTTGGPAELLEPESVLHVAPLSVSGRGDGCRRRFSSAGTATAVAGRHGWRPFGAAGPVRRNCDRLVGGAHPNGGQVPLAEGIGCPVRSASAPNFPRCAGATGAVGGGDSHDGDRGGG